MANIGSVFLGDSKRIRVLSSSTPPSSPPASSTSVSMSGMLSNLPSPKSPDASRPDGPNSSEAPLTASPAFDFHARPTLQPELALELRVRWLEALVLGVKDDNTTTVSALKKSTEVKQGETLIRTAQDLQKRLNSIVEGNDGLKRFVSHYDQHAQYLTPSFALSGLHETPTYENMTPTELETYLKEMESDIRSADRDMREIEALEQKGVTSAGKLASYVPLLPRLDKLMKAYAEDAERVEKLEKRIAGIIESHATYIDALSELFVAWDDAIIEAENETAREEREHEERVRLGLE
ncbi:hypothetical protein Moror_7007 [Moniliophthora roreri MCA 2997]|uniref:Uncharacterized protein n=2 Tax=Moniliophthora roreri TaxID=221103 RepID=V2YXQ9_MONRO|nr:hypothetical protein Moror_7007 [Moniliophthora roreri MCA 2997]